MLYRRAARADRGFAAADQEAHDQYVVLSRNLERREHERLLHDTMLNTLTAISRGASGPAAVVARCRQDIALLEHVLTASGDPADPVARAEASVVADVEAVVSEMRARGLRVHLEVACGGRGAGADSPVRQAGADITGRSFSTSGRGHRARHPGGAGQRGCSRRDGRGLGVSNPGAGPSASRSATRARVSIRRGWIRPGWGCAARSPSGSPTGAAARRSGRRRARGRWSP